MFLTFASWGKWKDLLQAWSELLIWKNILIAEVSTMTGKDGEIRMGLSVSRYDEVN